MGSNCTVSSAASTRVGLGSGADPWVPMEARVQGVESVLLLRNIQGIPDDQVQTVLENLEMMFPLQVRKWIDWDQTKNDRGPWPSKMMVGLWLD